MFPFPVLGGYFEIQAKVFGMFTYHGDPWDAPIGWQDEQDIEILSSSVLTPTQYNAAGIQLTNFHPE
jgi:hypothetical protein